MMHLKENTGIHKLRPTDPFLKNLWRASKQSSFFFLSLNIHFSISAAQRGYTFAGFKLILTWKHDLRCLIGILHTVCLSLVHILPTIVILILNMQVLEFNFDHMTGLSWSISLPPEAKQNKYFVSCNPTDRANNVPTVTNLINILKGKKEVVFFEFFYKLFFLQFFWGVLDLNS